jgi:hypothetical protein
MEDLIVPLYYLVGRNTDPELIHAILRITPCPTAIVTRYEDVAVASQYSDTVLLNADPVQTAHYTKRPVVVIGDGESIEEVYDQKQSEGDIEEPKGSAR